MTKTESLIKYRNFHIILFYIVFVLIMLYVYFFKDVIENSHRFLFSLLPGSIVASFCSADSKIRGKNLMHIQKTIIFFTWPLALPIYLISTRKLKGVGIVLLYNIILIITAVFLITLINFFL